jgi:hypothetical protein
MAKLRAFGRDEKADSAGKKKAPLPAEKGL